MSQNPGAGKKPYALVADDEPQLLAWLSAVVESFGFRVHSAKDGLEAAQFVENFAQTHPGEDLRLLISDWKMPNMEGPDLIQFVRAVGMGHLPCVLMSGAVSEAELRAALKSDVDAILLKPFTEAKLKVKVQEAVGRRAAKGASKAV